MMDQEALGPHSPQKCKLTSIYRPEYLYENTTKLEKPSFPPPGQEKTQSFPPLFLSCVSSLPLAQNISLLTLLVTKFGVGGSTQVTLCNTSWVSNNSDPNYWRQCQIPQVKGSVPQNCSPHQMPITSSRSPGYPQLLSDLATNQGFP